MTRKFPTRGKVAGSSDQRETSVGVVRKSRSLNFAEIQAASSPIIRFDEIPVSPCSPLVPSPFSPTNPFASPLRLTTGPDTPPSNVASPFARAAKWSLLQQHQEMCDLPFSLPVPETSADAEPAEELHRRWSSPIKQTADLADDDVTTFHDFEKQFEQQILQQDLTFRFAINYRCMPGECIRVVGSAGPLGEWDAEISPCMTWHPGDEWVLELTFPLMPRPTPDSPTREEPNLSRQTSPISSPTKSAIDGSTVIAHFEYKYCVTSAPPRDFRACRWENGTNRSFTITTKRAEGTRHFKLTDSWQE